MLYNAGFDVKKAVGFTPDHLKWRANTQPLTELGTSLMVGDHNQNSSFFFTLGKDKQFRPIVYVRLNVMNRKTEFGLPKDLKHEDMTPGIDWIFTLIRKECYRPYFIENWIMIVDADDMGVWSFPVNFFLKLLKMTEINHPNCLHKLFIVNTAFSFSAIVKMISRTLD